MRKGHHCYSITDCLTLLRIQESFPVAIVGNKPKFNEDCGPLEFENGKIVTLFDLAVLEACNHK